MKLFVVDPHYAEADNYVQVELGSPVVEFNIHNRNYTGLFLGYFPARESDKEGTPLNPKYLRITDAKTEERVTNLTFSDASNGKFCSASKVDAEADSDTEKAAIYLRVTEPDGKARCRDAFNYRKTHIFIEGRIYTHNVVDRTTDRASNFFCCPTIIVVTKNDPVDVIYYNRLTRSLRIMTLEYNGEEVVVKTNEEYTPTKRGDTNREVPKKDYKPRKQRLGSLGMALADALPPEYFMSANGKRDRNSRQRRRELNKAHKRYDD